MIMLAIYSRLTPSRNIHHTVLEWQNYQASKHQAKHFNISHINSKRGRLRPTNLTSRQHISNRAQNQLEDLTNLRRSRIEALMIMAMVRRVPEALEVNEVFAAG